jgi:hypothetical protein
MTTTTDQPENPPAFPSVETHPSYDMPMHYFGMTLRDYFAIHMAIDSEAGFPTEFAERLMGEKMSMGEDHHDWLLSAEAKYRYAFADAMLRERGK